jgi:EmrB/QacA subfamily drug resistance transporter
MARIARHPCTEARSPGATAHCPPEHRRWALIATILGSSMAFVDSTVVNIALPALQSTMGATLAQAQWVVEAYSLFISALMLTGGALGDRFGRKRIFMIGVALFTAASVACGLAPGIAALIAFRGVQGVGAALLVPGSLAIISATFPDRERGKAIGTWSAFTSVTMVIGPLVGGGLIEHVSWRAIFFINVPLAAATLWLCLRYVPESREGTRRALDPAGAVLATLGLGAVVYALIESSTTGFAHPLAWGPLAAGVALLALFVVVEWKGASPMMPLSLFRSPVFSGTNALTLFLYAALSGGLFFVPLDLIQLQGYTATEAGAATIPSVLILFLMSRWAGGLADRIGPKWLLVVGPLVAAAGFALFMVPGLDASYWTTFFPATVVLGVGMGITVAPLTNAVMGSVARDHAGIASGINNAVSETAALLAVAIFGLAMAHAFQAKLEPSLAEGRVPAQIRDGIVRQQSKLAAIEIPRASAPVQAAAKQAIGESFIAGFRLAELIAAALAALSALCAWIALGVISKPSRKG